MNGKSTKQAKKEEAARMVKVVEELLARKEWKFKRRKSTTGSIYFHCSCGYKTLLVRVSDHGPVSIKNLPDGVERFDVSFHPGGDELYTLTQKLNGYA